MYTMFTVSSCLHKDHGEKISLEENSLLMKDCDLYSGSYYVQYFDKAVKKKYPVVGLHLHIGTQGLGQATWLQFILYVYLKV